MDPESQKDRSTIEDRFAEQNVHRYSAWSSAIVIVGLVVVLGLLYFFLRLRPTLRRTFLRSTRAAGSGGVMARRDDSKSLRREAERRRAGQCYGLIARQWRLTGVTAFGCISAAPQARSRGRFWIRSGGLLRDFVATQHKQRAAIPT